MSRATQVSIDLGALRSNLEVVRRRAPGARVMAVIKANAYGHGMLRVAQALHAADAFAVACVDEALALRESGITLPIVLLEGCYDPSELQLAAQYALQCVVHHATQLDMLERAHLTQPLGIWLKIDTGMHRLGFLPERAADAYARLLRCANVAQPIALMTHLANADAPEDASTAAQLESFRRTIAEWSGPRSIANSAGLLAWRDSHADWVRPGVMLYGVSPFAQGDGGDFDLKPAMTLSSSLIAVNRYRRGDAIGYGGSWICPEDMPVGVVAVGYGDGYPRHAPPGTPVLINGVMAPLIGRVSMDMISIDLRSQPHAAVGDAVTLWGAGLPVEHIARHAGTIAYELLCRINPRISSVHVC